jgi:hypothetical protein
MMLPHRIRSGSKAEGGGARVECPAGDSCEVTAMMMMMMMIVVVRFVWVQMLAGSLLLRPEFRPHLFGGAECIPQVMFIQRWIEVRNRCRTQIFCQYQ